MSAVGFLQCRPVRALAMLFMLMAASGALQAQMKAVSPAQVAVKAPPAQALSADAQALVHWVMHSHDNESAPFVVIDKRLARLWLFDAQARPLAQTAVLLGLAHGDRSVPGIGERPLATIRPEERTTPAGRFIAEPGHNMAGEDIFWIDYDAAVSMHRVRASNSAEKRLERLATPTPADNRISFGCINVPAAFYDKHIQPLFSRHRGVVYLLPEGQALGSLFSGMKSKPPSPKD